LKKIKKKERLETGHEKAHSLTAHGEKTPAARSIAAGRCRPRTRHEQQRHGPVPQEEKKKNDLVAGRLLPRTWRPSSAKKDTGNVSRKRRSLSPRSTDQTTVGERGSNPNGRDRNNKALLNHSQLPARDMTGCSTNAKLRKENGGARSRHGREHGVKLCLHQVWNSWPTKRLRDATRTDGPSQWLDLRNLSYGGRKPVHDGEHSAPRDARGGGQNIESA